MRRLYGEGLRSLLGLALAGLVLAGPCQQRVFAQGSTGSIQGKVSGATGAAVPGARISLLQQGTSAARQAETDERGDFSLLLLSPGLYSLSVEAPGFKRLLLESVAVEVEEVAWLELQLQVGELSQEVVVTAAPALLQTTTSSVGQVVGTRSISRLPLNERNFLRFTLLVPGAQPASQGSQNSSVGGAISVNGAREQSNTFLLDGVDNNDLLINQFSVPPSVDAIQEFKVQSSSYSAEYGRTGGAQINVVLRSGTNQFHGTVFEFVRNRKLDAKNFFDLPDCTPGAAPGTCGEIPRYDRNQFGGTLGGPMRKDKLFFFAAYEGLRLREASTRTATVPSRQQRESALAAVPAAEQNIAGRALLELYPAANAGPDLAASNAFVATPVIRGSVDQVLVKVDYLAGASDTVSGHYAFQDEERFNPFDLLIPFTNLPGYGSFFPARSQNARLSWIHLFSPTRTQHARFGFNRVHGHGLHENFGQNKSAELGFPVIQPREIDHGYPNVTVAGFDGIGEPINLPQERADNTFHFAYDLAVIPSWQGGRHQIRLGVEVRRYQMNFFLDLFARGHWFFLGSFSGNPLEDLLRGTPELTIGSEGDTDSAVRTTAVNAFLQDDIRLSDTLTFNLGVRYERNSAPVENRDRFSVPDFSAASMNCQPVPSCQFIRASTGGIPRATYETDESNFAPRIGLAWRPWAKLVARTAYGIFYDATIANVSFFPRLNPPFFMNPSVANSGSSTIQDILEQTGIPLPVLPIMLAADFRDGYMQHWNLGVQYQPWEEIALDVAYVGSRGTSLTRTRNPNQRPPGGALPPFPQFGSIRYIESGAPSSYHSLQVSVQKRFSQGLTFLAGHTWSRSIDDASGALLGSAAEAEFPQNSMDTRADRGLSNFHTKHRFVLSYVYEIPLGHGRRWVNEDGSLGRLVGGWQVSGIATVQSGRPFTVNRGVDQSLTFGGLGFFDRPDLVADPFVAGPVASHPDPACHSTSAQGGRAAEQVRDAAGWFNPCAFAATGTARFGNLGRNNLIGPDLKNFDLSVSKEVRLNVEGHRLQFRVDIFNLLNRPNLDLPDRNFDSPTFARVESANASGLAPPRQVQLGLRYVF